MDGLATYIVPKKSARLDIAAVASEAQSGRFSCRRCSNLRLPSLCRWSHVAGHSELPQCSVQCWLPRGWSDGALVFDWKWAFRTAVRTGRVRAFFAGACATCFGSSYYHWSPRDSTLAWDRLPMTLAFMSLLAATISERISVTAGTRLLWPWWQQARPACGGGGGRATFGRIWLRSIFQFSS